MNCAERFGIDPQAPQDVAPIKGNRGNIQAAIRNVEAMEKWTPWISRNLDQQAHVVICANAKDCGLLAHASPFDRKVGVLHFETPRAV